MIQGKINYCKTFYLHIKEIDLLLPIIYCLPKIHEKTIGAIFIVALKNCSTKLFSDAISKILKNNFQYCIFMTKFLLVQISFPVIIKLNKINIKKNS